MAQSLRLGVRVEDTEDCFDYHVESTVRSSWKIQSMSDGKITIGREKWTSRLSPDPTKSRLDRDEAADHVTRARYVRRVARVNHNLHNKPLDIQLYNGNRNLSAIFQVIQSPQLELKGF